MIVHNTFFLARPAYNTTDNMCWIRLMLGFLNLSRIEAHIHITADASFFARVLVKSAKSENKVGACIFSSASTSDHVNDVRDLGDLDLSTDFTLSEHNRTTSL